MREWIMIKTAACAAALMIINSCTAPEKSPELIVTGLEFASSTTVFQPARKAMAKKYPNIKYELWTERYTSDTFLPLAVSGQLPTTYYCPFTDPDMIINSGYAGDITDIMKKYKFDEKIKEEYLELVERDGRYYGLPRYVYHMGLLCNNDIFAEAGLTDGDGYPLYPDTYEELAETASLIKKRTGKCGLFLTTIQNTGGWIFTNIAWSFGVNFAEERDGKWFAAFDTPECVEALSYIKDLRWKYDALQEDLLSDDIDYSQKYQNNKIGMKFVVSSELDRYSKVGTSLDSVALCKMPAGPAGRYSLVGGTIAMFNRDATPEELEACFLWYEEFGFNDNTDEEARKKYEKMVKISAEVGSIVGFADDSVWKSPERKAMEEEIEKKYANIDLNKFKEFNDDGVSYRLEEPVCCQELYHILDGVIQDVLMNEDSDPAALIKEAAHKYQTEYLDML